MLAYKQGHVNVAVLLLEQSVENGKHNYNIDYLLSHIFNPRQKYFIKSTRRRLRHFINH